MATISSGLGRFAISSVLLAQKPYQRPDHFNGGGSLCSPRALPTEVVSVNCRVLYRLDDEPGIQGHFLVHPLDLTDQADEPSVARPLGTALLGLHLGDRMPFCDNCLGIQHVVTVEGIGCRFVDEPVSMRGVLAPLEA
nr:transcription elongation factor GreAB [Methylobacterium oxalidis]